MYWNWISCLNTIEKRKVSLRKIWGQNWLWLLKKEIINAIIIKISELTSRAKLLFHGHAWNKNNVILSTAKMEIFDIIYILKPFPPPCSGRKWVCKFQLTNFFGKLSKNSCCEFIFKLCICITFFIGFSIKSWNQHL